MNSDKDTICAIATGVGEGGISIVRISGPASLVIADAVFQGKNCTPSKMAGGTFAHGFIKPDANGTNVDEVVLLVYRAPHSYTREDVVEIQGHGGRVCAQRILRTLLDNGGRLSEPGEFTKRAFLNGRIDLIQAEAVCDLVRAQSERAASAAMEQLEGRLSSSLNEIYSIGIAAAADLEATLDFDEDELPARVQAGVLSGISDAIRMTTALLATWEEGHLLRDGAKVVISGRPNVGKSTLMNLLLGKDRSIVADLPGTTRDVIEEQMLIDGIPVRLFDTAGLRESDCDVEREGVRRAQASIQQADMNIHVVDSSAPLYPDDRKHIEEADPNRCILILNKVDLGQSISPSAFPSFSVIPVSLLRGQHPRDIVDALALKLAAHSTPTPHAVIGERHRQLLQNALNALNEGSSLLSACFEKNAVPAATLLREALNCIGQMTGRSYSNELLDNIFRRFCVGK